MLLIHVEFFLRSRLLLLWKHLLELFFKRCIEGEEALPCASELRIASGTLITANGAGLRVRTTSYLNVLLLDDLANVLGD